MDWSAVYDNHGEEEGRWEDYGETRSSRNAHRLMHRKLSFALGPLSSSPRSLPHTAAATAAGDIDSTLDAPATQYSPLVAYAFTVNYILGVGSLGIPYAFYRAGLVLSNLLIILVTLISYMTVMWVSETVARAREAFAATAAATESTSLLLLVHSKHSSRNSNSSSRSSPIRSQQQQQQQQQQRVIDDFPEVTQLCERFLGPVASRLYQLALLGLMYGGLLGYSQVFVNSFLTQVTTVAGVHITSLHAAALFATIVVPLSLSDLTEQIHVQLLMSVVRFVALWIMIASALFAIYNDPFDSGLALEPTPILGQPPYISTLACADLSGFGVMFSTGVFSQLFQHSVPGLLAPLGAAAANQRRASTVFSATLGTTLLFYMALGTICALYFGARTATSVNLNWADFTWGLASSPSQLPLWAQAMSTLVVVFPALDTLSVYPLIAVTLGDNMAAVVPLRWRRTAQRKNAWKVACRIVACVPPLVVSVVVTDLSITLQFSGMAGVYVAFFAPALLQLAAQREFPAPTVYSGRFSDARYAYSVLVFGVFAFSILLYQFAQQLLSRDSA